MAKWGYRVYTFEMLEGWSNPTILMQELEGHRERLLGLLRTVGECTRLGKPAIRRAQETDEINQAQNAAEYDNTDPTLSLRCVDYSPGFNAIHAVVALGERGLHDYATNPEKMGDRIDVEDRAAETPLRVDFFLATAQTKGFIIAESIGMRDAVSPLVQWINYCSKEERKKRISVIECEERHQDANGQKITKKKALERVPPLFKIRVERVSDPDLLEDIINDMNSMEAEFIQMDANGKARKHKLSIKINTNKIRQGIIARFQNNTLTEDAIITQTLKDLDIDQQALERANVKPNRVKASIQSSQGRKTLVPGKISDLFTYSFEKPGRPKTALYYKTTLSKIDDLLETAQVALEIPDVVDVVAWVESEERSWGEKTQIDVQ